MAVPWTDVQAWIRKYNLECEVVEDAAMQRIRIDLAREDGFGGTHHTHSLYTAPSATRQSMGTFSTNDLAEAAGELSISWP